MVVYLYMCLSVCLSVAKDHNHYNHYYRVVELQIEKLKSPYTNRKDNLVQ